MKKRTGAVTSTIPGKRFELSTPCTTRGYHFILEVYDAWSFVVYRDVARGYVPIATLHIPTRYQNDAKARNNYCRRVARHLLTHYLVQHKAQHDGLRFLEASSLKAEELKDKVGLVRGTGGADHPVPHKSAPEVRPAAKKRRSVALEE